MRRLSGSTSNQLYRSNMKNPAYDFHHGSDFLPYAAFDPDGNCLIFLRIASAHDFDNLFISIQHEWEAVPVMRKCAAAAVFDAVFRIRAISAAFAAQRIEWAIAEQAVKRFHRHIRVTGKVFAFPVLKKAEMLGFCQGQSLLSRSDAVDQTPAVPRYSARPVS